MLDTELLCFSELSRLTLNFKCPNPSWHPPCDKDLVRQLAFSLTVGLKVTL
jgi:hypothetical protein